MILRIRRKGRTGTYRKLNENNMVIMEDKSLMAIDDYIELYYNNVLDTSIGYRETKIFEEVRIWDIENTRQVENLLDKCPPGSLSKNINDMFKLSNDDEKPWNYRK
jgi:hypothetical protein